jgi:hypothetical protein
MPTRITEISVGLADIITDAAPSTATASSETTR